MTKSDLRARPVFHHQREAIEAHLTVVFAALAITRYLTSATGTSIKKLVRTLRPLHTVTIDIGGHTFTAETPPSPEAAELLNKCRDAANLARSLGYVTYSAVGDRLTHT